MYSRDGWLRWLFVTVAITFRNIAPFFIMILYAMYEFGFFG